MIENKSCRDFSLYFRFLVVVDFLACAYALLQFMHQSVILIKRASPTRKRTLLLLAIDQAFSYLVIAAAAASAGASRTNKSAFRTLGVEQVHIAGVCTVLDRFCNHAMVAFIFTLLAAFCSVAGTAVDIYLLILAL
ncbi:hypothetical protein KP509_07G017800 [Ceratopteris richardii]|uniref:CASP-like protein n=1 Tax=Ceratopteris richardii TaxID=49495 RepID=A0A8T2UEU7_CERRI|nr:hypothetical protein KP509_07G017800 [Ceratopteris richardii]